MKVYDYQWAASFGMDAATAAGELARDGIDTVLVRNQIDPLPTSGVDQEAYLASGASVSRPRIAPGRTRFARPDFASTRRRHCSSTPGSCSRFRTRDQLTRTAIRTLDSTGIWASAPRTAATLRPRSIACNASPPSWNQTDSFCRSRATRGSGRTGFLVTPSPTPIASVSALGVAPGLPRIWTSTSLLAMPRPRRASSSKSTALHGPPGARGGSSRLSTHRRRGSCRAS